MKRSNNPYVERISRLVGETDPRRAIETFARAGAAAAAAQSLEALAYRLGVTRIVEEKLPFEGALFRLSHGELVIRLNSDSSYVRRRFTLAHEIAHLLLNTVPAFRSTQKTDAALERTCDMVAAELLMPSTEVCAFIRTLGAPSPEKLVEIASRYSVSLQTAAIRVRNDLRAWKCCIGMWELTSKPRTLWFVGTKRWTDVCPDQHCLQLALSSNSSIQTHDLWERGVSSERVWLQLLGKRNDTILGLVDFVN